MYQTITAIRVVVKRENGLRMKSDMRTRKGEGEEASDMR